jgi:hypothetical protein
VAGHGLALSGVIAVADASPLHYLILIGHIDLLPALFSRILVPPAVLNELRHRHAPALVREWASDPPRGSNARRPRARSPISRADWAPESGTRSPWHPRSFPRSF